MRALKAPRLPSPTGPPQDWQRVLDINLGGVWRCMRAEIPVMLAAGTGSIVNCASVAGLVGFPGIAPYVASKHGIIGITKTAALDYATAGIRVNAVCPGIIRTKMIERFTHGDAATETALVSAEPVGRMGDPIEVGAVVAWLCSDAASFVTGVGLPVDGGVCRAVARAADSVARPNTRTSTQDRLASTQTSRQHLEEPR